MLHRWQRRHAGVVHLGIALHFDLILERLTHFRHPSRIVQPAAQILRPVNDEGILPMLVRQQPVERIPLVLALTLLGHDVRAEDGAVDARHPILIREPLVSRNHPNQALLVVHVVIPDPRLSNLALIKRPIPGCPACRLNAVLHPVLVPLLTDDTLTHLVSRQVTDLVDVSRTLQVRGAGRNQQILVKRKRPHYRAVERLTRHNHICCTLLSKVYQRQLRCSFRQIRIHLPQGIPHHHIILRLCQHLLHLRRHGLGLNCFILKCNTPLPEYTRGSNPLLPHKLSTQLLLTLKIGNLAPDQPLQEVTHRLRPRYVVTLNRHRHQVRLPQRSLHQRNVSVDDLVYSKDL